MRSAGNRNDVPQFDETGYALLPSTRFGYGYPFEMKSNKEITIMAVARVTEIIAASDKSFEDAVKAGVKRASKTLKNVTGAWVKDSRVEVSDGKITEYRVVLKVTFILKD